MYYLRRAFLALALLVPFWLTAQETHDHTAPEELGVVSFSVSCKPGTQQEFDRGVALLHSFAYTAAQSAFRSVAERDPHCAMAHWGIAMAYFHQLWEPHLSPTAISTGQEEIRLAQQIGTTSERERKFIQALALIYQDAASAPYAIRGINYEHAMRDLAAGNRKDEEAQVFYALALVSNASPNDKTHSKQKQAAEILEPLYQTYPQHPGIPHYLIHAYDNAELAPKGLAAATVYAKIAPSAPHALHMPSHIFTRLGLWDDSIQSNVAARNAAHQQGDMGEELHAMDYLVYAYLQSGRDADAAEVIKQLNDMPPGKAGDFKIGYAATAMPVRYAVERQQWAEAVSIVPPAAGPPQVIAMAVWARGIGLTRTNRPADAQKEIDQLRRLEEQLRTSGDEYWASQVKIMTTEVMAWSAQADNKPEQALTLMRRAADEEDAIEKLPVTPGPIVPAREQLGDLLLEQGRPAQAATEFKTALVNAPGRRGALQGAQQAAQLSARGS